MADIKVIYIATLIYIKLARCPVQFARVSSFSSKLLDFFTLEKLNANSFV